MLTKKLIKELKLAVQVGVEIEVEVEVGIDSAAIVEGATDKRAHTLNSVKGGIIEIFPI
mgnify:FL=1